MTDPDRISLTEDQLRSGLADAIHDVARVYIDEATARRLVREFFGRAGAERAEAKHYRTGPGKCVCGFNAYKLSEFVFDYGDRLQVHIREASR